jgi:catechol 2,3-dioxygenase-like lactoylglutathione lyase family enzyme
MPTNPCLRLASEYAEPQAPDHVRRLLRVEPLLKATELAFLRFEKPDLHKAERFWSDFGLLTVSMSGDRLVMRGTGTSAAVLVATKGRRSRFVGSAFVVPDAADLSQLTSQPGARSLGASEIPGGGGGVALCDPDGNEVWLVHHWGRLDPIATRAPLNARANTLQHVPRVNLAVRPAIEPAQIGRLGHVVLQTPDFEQMAQWYMRHLGLIPTDVQYLPDGSPQLAFMRLDLGSTPADHHTVVIGAGLQPRYEHSAWEVIDLDALGLGQQVMRANGHRHMWGIGRHVLGSQLFDYWYDPDGLEFEHYTDGDVYTSDHVTQYVPFTTQSIWAWGPDIPRAMFPPKTPAMLWRVIQLLRAKRTTLSRILLLGRAVDAPARPWL